VAQDLIVDHQASKYADHAAGLRNQRTKCCPNYFYEVCAGQQTMTFHPPSDYGMGIKMLGWMGGFSDSGNPHPG